MNVGHFGQLFRYDAWANRRVWACVASLSDQQFTEDLHFSVGSVRTQILHTMAVQSWWVHFLATGEIRYLDHDDYPTRDTILPGWDRVEAATTIYLGGLTDDDLSRMVQPGHWSASEQPVAVWQALFQVINHSTDHRAQTLAGIHRLGGTTTAQDFLFHVWGDTATDLT